MPSDEKRVFFGLEVVSPWPKELPPGRSIDESHRHVTLAFIGHVHFPTLHALLPSFPQPPFHVGVVGQFDHCLPLPKRHPHVIAWHMQWLEDAQDLLLFQKSVIHWLIQNGFSLLNPKRKFLPHVTICRPPFVEREWIKAFHPLPFFVKDIHLYESLGHSKYQSIWHYSLKAPFEEIEHTADLAFLIRGKDLNQLYQHAQMALAFKHPPFLSYFDSPKEINQLEDLIIHLNHLITQLDVDQGSPFKAISFHDKMRTEEPNLLLWEMIIDV